MDLAVAAFIFVPIAAAHGLLRRLPGGLRLQLLLDVALLALIGRFLLPGAHLVPGLPGRAAWGGPARVSGSAESEDLPLQLAPAWDEVRRLASAGLPPWISDRIGGGTPLFANGLSGVPFPLNLPVWLLGAERGNDAMSVWKLELAVLGMFFLLRRLRVGCAAATFGALAFGLCPYFLSHLVFPLGWVVAATPWAFWAVLAALRGNRAAAAGLALLLGSLAGWSTHPEAAGFLLLACGLGGFVLALGRARRLVRLTLPLVIALLVSAAGSVPVYRTIRGSSKFAHETELAQERQTLSGGERLLLAGLLVSPWREGHPDAGTFHHSFPLLGLQLGAGSIAFAALFFSGIRRRHFRAALAFGIVGLAAGLLFFQAPLLTPLLRRIPVLDVMIWFRSGFLVAFGLSAGGALTFDAWLRRPRKVRAVAATIGVEALCLAALVRAPGVLPPEAAAAPLFVGLTGVAVTLGSGGAAAALPLLVLGEQVVSGWRIVPAATEPTAPPPIIAELKRRAVDGERVVGLRDALTPNLASRWALPDLRDNAPVRSVALRNLHEAFGSHGASLPGPLERPWPGLAGAWGVRWLATPPHAAADPATDGWREVFGTEEGGIFENPRVLPVLRCASRLAPLPASWNSESDSGDFRTTAFVASPASLPALGGEARLEVLSHRPSEWRARVHARGRIMAVLHVPFAAGWRATMDGPAAPIVLANVAGMGILVPDGTHEVSWIYSPPGLGIGIAATLLGLAACAVLLFARKR